MKVSITEKYSQPLCSVTVFEHKNSRIRRGMQLFCSIEIGKSRRTSSRQYYLDRVLRDRS